MSVKFKQCHYSALRDEIHTRGGPGAVSMATDVIWRDAHANMPASAVYMCIRAPMGSGQRCVVRSLCMFFFHPCSRVYFTFRASEPQRAGVSHIVSPTRRPMFNSWEQVSSAVNTFPRPGGLTSVQYLKH